jgi:biotin carboxyl carrier protein
VETYTIRAETGTFELEVHRDGRIMIDGRRVEYELIPLTKPFYRLVIDGKAFEVAMPDPVGSGGEASVYTDGERIDLTVEDRRLRLMKSLQSERTTKMHAAAIRSPMPGRITSLLVHEGELIEEGQGVCILEAMKMENEIRSPVAGIVKSVKVNESDAVEKNAVLIEIS